MPQAATITQNAPRSRMEVKSDATTRAAREIISREASARVAKTERLRAARLAEEAKEAKEAEKAPPAKKAKRKK